MTLLRINWPNFGSLRRLQIQDKSRTPWNTGQDPEIKDCPGKSRTDGHLSWDGWWSLGYCSFPVATTWAWNALPDFITAAPTSCCILFFLIFNNQRICLKSDTMSHCCYKVRSVSVPDKLTVCLQAVKSVSRSTVWLSFKQARICSDLCILLRLPLPQKFLFSLVLLVEILVFISFSFFWSL